MLDRHILIGLGVGSALVCSVAAVQASDHLDAPGVVDNGQSDVNDLYTFQSPDNPDNTVLIQTVNPFAGEPRPDFFDPQGSPSPTTFGTDVDYQFRIDNGGDASPDVTYTTTFSDGPSGDAQNFTVSRQGTEIASGSTGSEVSTSNGGRVQAGLFDDPFFFDERGFFRFKNGTGGFTGTDAFAGANVSAIVLEVPTDQLGATEVAIDATTSDEDGDRIDRVGRPAINTALIPDGQKNDFNQGNPSTDEAEFTDELIASINAINDLAGNTGEDRADAEALAEALLPDQLNYDSSQPTGFLNGRLLTDDVIDTELSLLTNGAITGDGVDGNDVPFPDAFPYLAAPQDVTNPNVIPTPSAVGGGIALLLGTGGIAAWRRRRNA